MAGRWIDRVITIGLSVGVCGGIFFALERGQSKPLMVRAASAKEPAVAEGQDKTVVLQQQIAALEQQVQGLNHRAVAATMTDALKPNGERPLDPVHNPEDRAAAEQQRRVQMDAIAKNFNAEPADESWATSTTLALRAALDKSAWKGGTARDVECRSKTCRVELDDDGTGATNEALPQFAMGFAQTLPGITADHIADANGHQITVLYMTRPN